MGFEIAGLRSRGRKKGITIAERVRTSHFQVLSLQLILIDISGVALKYQATASATYFGAMVNKVNVYNFPDKTIYGCSTRPVCCKHIETLLRQCLLWVSDLECSGTNNTGYLFAYWKAMNMEYRNCRIEEYTMKINRQMHPYHDAWKSRREKYIYPANPPTLLPLPPLPLLRHLLSSFQLDHNG